jgi:hypothetical protein
VEQRLRAECRQVVSGWSPIVGGTQNRLFRLDTLAGAALLAKFYHQDRWNRLHRECSTLSLLGRHELARVPRVYVRSDDFGYGVYSFEPGKAKGVVEHEPGDLRAVGSFAADLHRVAPSASGKDLSSAVGASFSIEQQLDVIDRRLRGFETFAGSPEAYDQVRDLCRELDLRVAISELIQRTTAGLSQQW